MKLTKRMKSAIIQASIVNIVFFLILVFAITLFIVPKINEIISLKWDLWQIYNDYNTKKQNGITYGELRQIANQESLNNDAYISNLLRNVNQNFYEQSFTNTWSQPFSEFLETVESRVLDVKFSDEYIIQDQKLNTVLPVYTQDNSLQKDGLTDFYFINYIENLIYTFNLWVRWEVWVWAIEKIWENSRTTDEEEQDNALQEDIFRIPLHFEIDGQKSDIVDFIHFFENVGSINLKDNSLEIYNDKFISKVIEWEIRTSSYNIYENQISDIESIEWKEYPDSSTQAQSWDLITALKWPQAREKASIELHLNFYVAGVPGYRMEKYVQDVIDDFQSLSQLISADAKRYTVQAYKYKEWVQLQAITQLQNLDALMVDQQEWIQQMTLAMVRKDNIQDLYEKAVNFRAIIRWVDQSYDQQKIKLNAN